MRITLVCPFDPRPPAVNGRAANVGGVERVFAEVSHRLAARGHDVTLVCSTDGPEGRSVEDGVSVVRQKRLMTLMRAPVCTLTRRIPYTADIVHVAATYPFTTPAVLQRAHKMGIPTVLDFHFEHHPAMQGAPFLASHSGGEIGAALPRGQSSTNQPAA